MKKSINKKRYFGIFLLLMVIWVSLFGEYVQLSASGEISGNWKLACFVQFLITCCIMFFVPFIFFILNGDRLENKKGKIICIWNSIILFIISLVFKITMDFTFVGGLGCIAFYFINKWLFVYYLDEPKRTFKYKETKIKTSNKKDKIESGNIKKSNVRYCKLCGNQLDEDNYCEKCNKQYFKLKRPSNFSVALICLLIISLIFNIRFMRSLKNVQECPKYHTTDCSTYCDVYNAFEIEKLNFLDENIVFVIEGYGNYYYTYDCMEQVTDGSEYSYWAYNKEAAISKGYKPSSCNK